MATTFTKAHKICLHQPTGWAQPQPKTEETKHLPGSRPHNIPSKRSRETALPSNGKRRRCITDGTAHHSSPTQRTTSEEPLCSQRNHPSQLAPASRSSSRTEHSSSRQTVPNAPPKQLPRHGYRNYRPWEKHQMLPDLRSAIASSPTATQLPEKWMHILPNSAYSTKEREEAEKLHTTQRQLLREFVITHACLVARSPHLDLLAFREIWTQGNLPRSTTRRRIDSSVAHSSPSQRPSEPHIRCRGPSSGRTKPSSSDCPVALWAAAASRAHPNDRLSHSQRYRDPMVASTYKRSCPIRKNTTVPPTSILSHISSAEL